MYQRDLVACRLPGRRWAMDISDRLEVKVITTLTPLTPFEAVMTTLPLLKPLAPLKPCKSSPLRFEIRVVACFA